MFSANGELTIDVINQDTPPGFDSVSRVQVVLAFSPLVHIPTGNIEVVVGPKLGFWGEGDSFSSAGIADSGSASGFAIGLNAGLFGAISPSVSAGGLISFDIRTVGEVCSTPSGGSQTCSSDPALTGPADKVLGFNGALLF